MVRQCRAGNQRNAALITGVPFSLIQVNESIKKLSKKSFGIIILRQEKLPSVALRFETMLFVLVRCAEC